jgi:aminoglycoside N3'-acetyltransferase
MTSPNTVASLTSDLVALGLRPALTVMVHSSLGRLHRALVDFAERYFRETLTSP